MSHPAAGCEGESVVHGMLAASMPVSSGGRKKSVRNGPAEISRVIKCTKEMAAPDNGEISSLASIGVADAKPMLAKPAARRK